MHGETRIVKMVIFFMAYKLPSMKKTKTHYYETFKREATVIIANTVIWPHFYSMAHNEAEKHDK